MYPNYTKLTEQSICFAFVSVILQNDLLFSSSDSSTVIRVHHVFHLCKNHHGIQLKAMSHD